MVLPHCVPEDELPVTLDDRFEFPETGEEFHVQLPFFQERRGESPINKALQVHTFAFKLQLLDDWLLESMTSIPLR
jgi:hypothetical protein